ncbi:MAG: KH domain-containing protein [Acidobacteria bacterium]|nr:KH domain-containing protein [Acidobacteriota bacterium]
MKEAIEKIAKAIVGDPDAVETDEFIEGGRNVKITVRVGPDDYGRLIGREGRTIKAIRSVLHFAGMKQEKRFFLDLVED